MWFSFASEIFNFKDHKRFPQSIQQKENQSTHNPFQMINNGRTTSPLFWSFLTKKLKYLSLFNYYLMTEVCTTKVENYISSFLKVSITPFDQTKVHTIFINVGFY